MLRLTGAPDDVRDRPATGLHPLQGQRDLGHNFVFDTTPEGQQIKCLTVNDEYIRECLAIDAAGSDRSKRVVETLSLVGNLHGALARRQLS